MIITRLQPRVEVRLDRAAIEELCRTLGTARAQEVVGRSMEELAFWMARCDRLWRAGNRNEVVRLARLIGTVAARLGLDELAEVAGVLAAMGTADEATLGALVQRLVRVGEGSLALIWDVGPAG